VPQDMGLDCIDEIGRQLVVARFVAETIGRVSAKSEMELKMKAMVEDKNREIGRLRDKIQFYEVVNHEMSRRNQEVIEIARRRRHTRKKRQKNSLDFICCGSYHWYHSSSPVLCYRARKELYDLTGHSD